MEISVGANYLLNDGNVTNTKFGFGMSVKRIWLSEKQINIISGLIFEKTKYFEATYPCGGHFSYYKYMNFSTYSFAIPLLFRANVGKKNTLFFESGMTFEIIPFKIGKGFKITDLPGNDIHISKISEVFNRDLIDYGVNLGFGYCFLFKNQRLILSSNYHRSIMLLFDEVNYKLSQYITMKIGIIIGNK
ncbi:MAG: hypothetical protein Kow0068_01640 [Marinilabiliales bacterium]